MFTSEGLFTDVNGDPINATLFLGIPNQVSTANALTIIGTTATVRTALGWQPMGPVAHAASRDHVRIIRRSRAASDGFSLIEVIVAMSILMVGLLGLAQVFYFGMVIVGTSSAQLIAREKAREAIESVHTARDTRVITWAQIRNVGDAGLPGGLGANAAANGGGVLHQRRAVRCSQPARRPGRDRDDAGQEMTPGPDNTLGTADDIPLVGFTRQIAICDINGNPNLRQIAVTIRYNGSARGRQPAAHLHADHLHLELLVRTTP